MVTLAVFFHGLFTSGKNPMEWLKACAFLMVMETMTVVIYLRLWGDRL